jgi:hypothetical protein
MVPNYLYTDLILRMLPCILHFAHPQPIGVEYAGILIPLTLVTEALKERQGTRNIRIRRGESLWTIWSNRLQTSPSYLNQ